MLNLGFSEKATKFDEISILVLTVLLTYVINVKTKMDISSNFVALSEYLNLKKPVSE